MMVMPFAVPDRLKSLAPSQIRENMRIAAEVGAINMAQGRPDFAADERVKQAAVDAILEDRNQYSVTWGVPELRQKVSAMLADRYDLEVDPEREVTITCGVTEGMVGALMATIQAGDHALIVEPAHENYVPAVRFTGAAPRFLALSAPLFALTKDELEDAITDRTKVIILNTPHNPTGRVFTEHEIETVSKACRERDILLLTDEIYDRLTYDEREHRPPASFEGMRERTITTGGISKIHCVTGWRLGYVVAPPPITDAIRVVHDYTTICAPTPLQHAAIVALSQPESYYERLRDRFTARRRQMMNTLEASGFSARPPEGAYYVMANYDEWGFDGNATAFTRYLIEEVGVATVPGPAFYLGHPDQGEGLVRFAFAKTEATMKTVEERLVRGFGRR
jgi:aminotransferase